MVALGLRETKEVDMIEGISRIIANHYHTSGDEYEETIAQLMDLRHSLKSLTRLDLSINKHLVYFKQMEFVEKRFLLNNDGNSIVFEW